MSKITTVIDLNDVDIKIFQASKTRWKQKIIYGDIRSIIGSSDADISVHLKGVLGSLPFSPNNPIVIIPRRFAILRQMKLPAHNDQELNDMIGLQLVNRIPYSIENIIYRYCVLEKNDSGYYRILVVIISRDVIQRYRKIAEGAGIKKADITISSFGIANWLHHLIKIHESLNEQAVAVLNADSQYSEMCFYHKGKLFFSRCLSYSRTCSVLEDMDKLIDQIMLSLDMYGEGCLGPKIQQLLIVIPYNNVLNLKKQLECKIGLPVKTVRPLKDLREPVLDKLITQKRYSFSLIAGIGMLRSDASGLINFAPREDHIKEQGRMSKRLAVKILTAVLLVLFSVVVGQLIDINRSESRLKALQKRTEQIQPELIKANEKIRLIELFDQKARNHYFIPGLIEKISVLTPEEISFRELTFDEGGGLTVRGYAKAHSSINKFQSNLIESPYFQDVDLQFVTHRRISNASIMDFEIAMKFNEPEGNPPWPSI